jgi:hypothetical protein
MLIPDLDESTGLGIVFHEGNDLVGIDLDDAICKETGEISPFAEEIVKSLDSYTEISPSGTGLHIYIRISGTKPGALKRPDIEIYSKGRFFTLTGNHWHGTPLTLRVLESLDLNLPDTKPKATVPTVHIEKDSNRSIAWGEIDNRLFARACRARDDGYEEDEILELLKLWRNRDVVDADKVDDSHLEDIAASAMRYETTAPEVEASHWESKPALTTPLSLLDAPGWIGDLARDIYDSAIIPNAAATLAAIIPALGVLYGRRYETERGLRTNSYALIISPPGNGKDHPRKVMKRLFKEAGRPILYAVDDVTSDAAIHALLVDHQSIAILMDEFGELLQNASRSRGPAQTILRTLLSVYNQANEVYYAKRMASGEGEIIECPNLCIWGAGTPDQMQRALSGKSAGSGLLSRVMLFQEPNKIRPRPAAGRITVEPYVERVKAQLDKMSESEVLASSGQCQRVEVESDELQVFDAKLRDKIDKSPEMLANILVRIHEHVRKLLLMTLAATQLRRESTAWAISMGEHQIEQAIYWYERSIGVTDRENVSKFVMVLIEKSGSKGIKHSKLVEQTRHLTRNERSEIIEDMIDAGLIQRSKLRKGGYEYFLTKST